MASPALRASSIPGAGSSDDRTVTKPTGTVDNDILVCFAYVESDVTITPPAGWTEKLLNEQNQSGEEHRLYCWWHRAASDGANYTWTWTGSIFNDFSVHAFSGALTSGDPFQQTNTAINTTSAVVATPAVSLTTTTADTTLIWAASNFQSNSWDTDPAAFTALYDASYARCFYKAQAAAGGSGSIACNNNVAAFQTAMLLSLASIADSGGGTTTTKTMTDTVAMTDAALDPTYRVRQMSETVALTDQTVIWRRLKRVADESMTVVDSVVKSLIQAGGTVYTKVMTDVLTATDAVVLWLRRVRGPIDTVTLTDGDMYRTSLITASDELSTSDGFVSWRRLRRLAQDNIDLIDGFSKTLAGAGIVYAKVLSDSVTLVDDAGRRWTLRTRQVSETTGLSDQVIRYLRRVRTLGDDIEYSDGTVKVRQTVRTIDESIEVGDDKVSTVYRDQVSNTSFSFGSSSPPFRFGGM